MKSKLSFILLVLCALLALSACQTAQAPDLEPAEPPTEAAEPEAPAPEKLTADPSLSQREQEMIEDIEFLREAYKEKHIEPFLVCSEAEFDFKLDQVKAKVSELSDVEFYYELYGVLAGMGDGHTQIHPSEELSAEINGRRFPIDLQTIGDQLYLCGYLEGYEQFAPYLLREVVSVNGIDAAYLKRKAEMALNPFNRWMGKEYWGWMLTNLAFLDWAGCDYKEGYTFQFLNDNQEAESVEVPVITASEADEGTWVYYENWDRRLFGKTGGENWAEYIEGENGGGIYLHYSMLTYPRDIIDSFNAAGALIQEHPDCGKLVIDMRDHPGGKPDRIPQVRESTKQLVSPTIKQTYIVTGGGTASAAINSLGIFQDMMDDPIVIGEPTGQFDPFLWAGDRTAYYQLPHSKHYGAISRAWCDAETDTEAYYDGDGRLYPWESTILPDVYIRQEIEDVRQGKDTVIEWVLAQ